MQSLFTVMIVVCAASLICTILSAFISDGSTKKIVNMVLGAFVVCSLIMPIKSAAESFGAEISASETAEEHTASCDEIMSNQIVMQTRENLESAAEDLLLQNGISVNSCDVVLAQTDNNSIIISSLSIYIDSALQYNDSEINRIIEDNFSVTPIIITE